MVVKNAFFQTLVLTIIVFGIGVLLGFFLEDSRAKDIDNKLIESEINLLDEQIRNRGLIDFNVDCGTSKTSTMNFADEIYQEALKLEKLDASSKFSDILKTTHKRYDLLRILLWLEGIELKEKCGEKIHTVVYLFEYGIDDIPSKARQASLSRLLTDLKNEHGDKILLIPIATNLDIKSVDLILEKYEIQKIPTIVIDEEKILNDEVTFSELEKITFNLPGYEKFEGKAFKTFKNDNNVISLN